MNNNTPEKATILVVDDTPANLKLLQEMLQSKGYRVLASPDGKKSLNAAAKSPPDLILLDINMPEMNGFEVCERLKANELLKDIPILFISALTETTDKVKAFSVGGVDYISKPFQFEEVNARVETHLGIRALQRQLSAQNENLERLVAERTKELAKANERLLELGKIKDDFLGMISHELRTPANGVLGIAELIIDLCPASEDRTLYSNLFRESSLRMQNLIEDATMIACIEKVPMNSSTAISFSALQDEVQASLKEIQISMVQGIAGPVFLQGDRTLLKRAMETMILLATAFSRNKHKVQMAAVAEALTIRVRLSVDNLSLSEEQAADFFEIVSSVRSLSTAETLGLAPVVAHKIISAFGGAMRLVKGEDKTGYLEAILIREQDHILQE